MKAGFSFCGTDISKLGLEYAPEIEDVYVYRPSTANIHEETFDGHHGGYFYGATYQPKEFKLKCFFQDSQIDRGIFSQIYALFRKGKSGQLIFTRRPWCYYYATVTEVDDTGLFNYKNGVITVTMKAYYPFARCDSFLNEKTDRYHDDVMLNSALFDTEEMVSVLPFAKFNIKAKTTLYLPNPGTEKSRVSISIAGNVGGGVDIKNETNGQTCGFVAISKDLTNIVSQSDMSLNTYVYTDGISGKTMLISPSQKKIAFMYHDHGFIELEPAFPALRNIYISYSGTNVSTVNNLPQDVVGQFIFAGGKWRRITSQNGTDLVVSGLTGEGTLRTMIIGMNKIVVSPRTTMDLTMLKFDYKPTFA